MIATQSLHFSSPNLIISFWDSFDWKTISDRRQSEIEDREVALKRNHEAPTTTLSAPKLNEISNCTLMLYYATCVTIIGDHLYHFSTLNNNNNNNSSCFLCLLQSTQMEPLRNWSFIVDLSQTFQTHDFESNLTRVDSFPLRRYLYINTKI